MVLLFFIFLKDFIFRKLYTQHEPKLIIPRLRAACWMSLPRTLCFQLFEDPPYRLPQWLYHFAFPPRAHDSSLFSKSSPKTSLPYEGTTSSLWPSTTQVHPCSLFTNRHLVSLAADLSKPWPSPGTWTWLLCPWHFLIWSILFFIVVWEYVL